MEYREEILFGKIARKLGFVTKEEIQECVRIQDQLDKSKPLGKILIERGYVSPEEIEKIVEKQEENLRQKGKITREMKRESLYGKLALRFGFATKDEVNEAVRIQASYREEEQDVLPLGTIMKSRGVISEDEHEMILKYQENNLLPCPNCGKEYNMVMYNPGSDIPCYQCKDGTIKVPDLPEELMSVKE